MTTKTVKLAGELGQQSQESSDYSGETYKTTLSTGKVVIMREMSARDLLFMEKKLSNVGDIERGMRLSERLSMDPGKITFPEIQNLGVRDFKKVSELAGKAGGLEDDDDDDMDSDIDEEGGSDFLG